LALYYSHHHSDPILFHPFSVTLSQHNIPGPLTPHIRNLLSKKNRTDGRTDGQTFLLFIKFFQSSLAPRIFSPQRDFCSLNCV
jgi:hypothetical protein